MMEPIEHALPLSAQAAKRPDAASRAAWDWDVLDAELRPRLIRTGMSRFGFSREEAEDIVQTLWLKSMCVDARVRDPVAYLKAGFLNTCCNALRSASRHPGQAIDCVVPDERTQRRIAQLEAIGMVRRAFQEVAPRCRQLIRRYYLNDASLAEAAAGTGHSTKAVWKQIRSCLRKMRESLTS